LSVRTLLVCRRPKTSTKCDLTGSAALGAKRPFVKIVP
jgi:hypothetical protein